MKNNEKSWRHAYLDWMFSPDGFRKTEPRDEWSHFLNRLEGDARRKKNKLPRKLKKKLKKARIKQIYLAPLDSIDMFNEEIKLKPGHKWFKVSATIK